MIVSFDLYTVFYVIILVPVLTFLCVFAYRIGKSLEIALLEKWNRRIVNENKKVILENIKCSRELISVQEDLRDELRLTKKELKDGDVE